MEIASNTPKVDFKVLVGKMQAEENLNSLEQKHIFSAVESHIDGLIKIGIEVSDSSLVANRDILRKYYDKPQVVKDYLLMAVLGRILRLSKEAEKNDQKEAESVLEFNDLRGSICKNLSICTDEVSDEKMIKTLQDISDSYMDKLFNNDTVSENMTFIREASSVLVPENPIIVIEPEEGVDNTKIILD